MDVMVHMCNFQLRQNDCTKPAWDTQEVIVPGLQNETVSQDKQTELKQKVYVSQYK